MSKKIGTLVLFLLIFLYFFTPKIYASQYSLSITPDSYWIVAKPGAEFNLPYTISNSGDPVVIGIKTYIAKITDSEGNVSLSPLSDSSQITFGLQNSSEPLDSAFLIKTAEAVEFEISGKINPEIEQGDYYFVFVAESAKSESFEQGTSINILGGVGSILYLSVTNEGNLEENTKIVNFDTNSLGRIKIGDKIIKIADSSKPVDPILTIANIGANLVEISGKISITSRLSSNKSIIEIPKQKIPAESQKNLLKNMFDEKIPFLYGIFGFYEIKANFLFGQSGSPINETTYLILFPVKWSLITTGIIFLFFGFWKLKK